MQGRSDENNLINTFIKKNHISQADSKAIHVSLDSISSIIYGIHHQLSWPRLGLTQTKFNLIHLTSFPGHFWMIVYWGGRYSNNIPCFHIFRQSLFNNQMISSDKHLTQILQMLIDKSSMKRKNKYLTSQWIYWNPFHPAELYGELLLRQAGESAGEAISLRQSGSYELQPSFTLSERQITALWYTTYSYARFKMDAVICMSTWKLYICLIHITNYLYYDLWYIWWFTCCTNISGPLEIRKNLPKQICYLPVKQIVAYTVGCFYNKVLKITLDWDRT